MKQSTPLLLLWLTLFSVAMGFLESAVVVYLREIYYPAGFRFPLQAIEGHMAITEIGREAATLVMLLCIAVIAGRNITERFAWFIFCFAVWDLSYYAFLKVLLDWPRSLLTWDILFLIPLTWTGPVIAPMIASLSMILLAVVIIPPGKGKMPARVSPFHWIMLVTGALIIILSFSWDYSAFILEQYSLGEIWSVPRKTLLELSLQYVPGSFNWELFVTAEMLILLTIFLIYMRSRQRETRAG